MISDSDTDSEESDAPLPPVPPAAQRDIDSEDLEEGDEGVFEVKELLKKCQDKKGRMIYLVQWSPVEQYPEPTWEPYSSISQCKEALAAFRKKEKQQRAANEEPGDGANKEAGAGGGVVNHTNSP